MKAAPTGKYTASIPFMDMNSNFNDNGTMDFDNLKIVHQEINEFQ